ncbi:MAG: 4Fe-4S dicluster domain-containing protein [Armatimonadota bacterium]
MAVTQRLTADGEQFTRRVAELSGQDPSRCYQCGKCTAGCPLAFAMDIDPARTMRLVQLGLKDAALDSKSFWLCSSCETCATRCPQEVDLPRVMDALRIIALRAGRTADPCVVSFNRSFLDSVRKRGRASEIETIVLYKLRSRRLFQDVDKGVAMMLHRKLPLLPHKVPSAKQAERIFEAVEALERE